MAKRAAILHTPLAVPLAAQEILGRSDPRLLLVVGGEVYNPGSGSSTSGSDHLGWGSVFSVA